MNEEDKNSPEPKSYSTIRFFDSEQMLKVDFTADSLTTPLEQEAILEILNQSDYSKHQLNEEMLQKLSSISEQNYDKEISIEQHTDASFEFIVDKDEMSLAIKVETAKGGDDLNYNHVLDALLETSVNPEYIDKEKLKLSLIGDAEESISIAKGIEPIHGEDSYFEVLFNINTEKSPKDSADGTINHYDTRDYITVEMNQGVMKRIPHTLATSGMTVYGEDIAGEDGKKIEFSIDDSVSTSESDPNLLIASKKGHPVATETGVHIDDTLTIKNASLQSGNINFDGSVQITGDVMPNVVIEATGDIHVKGMVENASLIAGNDITICAGVLSSKLYDKNDQESYTPECFIKAQGTIIAKYCNSIGASAKKHILVETYAMHSQLSAGENIIIGNNNGKGALIGGHSSAKKGLITNTLGSAAYVITHVSCGNIAELKKLNKRISNFLKRTKSELTLLEAVLTKIKNKGSPTKVGDVVLQKAKKIHDEINELKRKTLSAESKIIEVHKELLLSKSVKININKKLFPNVHITINGINTVSKREREQAVISCEDYEINFN
jgi:uncharacterized protein (DUF342 family)